VARSGVIVSPTDTACFRPGASCRRLSRDCTLLGLAASILLGLGACSEAPLPQRRLQVGDCLNRIDLDHLNEALERCNRVVLTYPQDPQPLNERFLLHSLMGQDKAACQDIAKADQLAHRRPPSGLDPLLRQELKLRLASCRD